MASRDEIVAFANNYLRADDFDDYAPTGLQVVGATTVSKLACGVSASRELFKRARELEAELVVVHHGLFWNSDPRVIDDQMRSRLEELFAGDVNLLAYHLCLDAHPEIGNNALLADALGVAADRQPFAQVGLGGTLAQACTTDALVDRVRRQLGREPLVFASGPNSIKRIAICSGSAASAITQAAAEGYDCVLTGEPREPTMMAARELGITFIAAGHYATETFGVRALTERIGTEFDLPWDFIELDNPV